MSLRFRKARGPFTAAAVTAAVSLPAAAWPAAVAHAAPVHGANITTGTADCGSVGMFAFVVSGSRGLGTPWNVAFVMSSTGARALFHPYTLDLVLTSPAGTTPQVASRTGQVGPISCTIIGSPGPGLTITGTVTGTMTMLG